MHILHIDCSATDGMDSHSRRLSAALVEKFKAANAGTTVTYRDVAKDRLPHVDMTIRQAWSPEGEKDRDLSETAARSKAAVDQLKAADVLVIGAPMYNFSVPSTLKSWIDHVVIAGQTFRYTESGPVGLLTGEQPGGGGPPLTLGRRTAIRSCGAGGRRAAPRARPRRPALRRGAGRHRRCCRPRA